MTPLPRTLLVISPEETARNDLRRGFRAAGHQVMTVATTAEAEQLLDGIGVDAVLVHGDEAMMATVRTFAGGVPVLQVVRDDGDESEGEGEGEGECEAEEGAGAGLGRAKPRYVN